MDNNLWAIGWLTTEPWFPLSPHTANTYVPSLSALIGFPPRAGLVTRTPTVLIAGRQVPTGSGSYPFDGDYADWKAAFPPNGGGWW